MTKPYAVSLWGSCPDAGSDDCWCGVDFDTKAEAEAAYRNPSTIDAAGFGRTLTEAIWIEVAGPDIVKHRRLRPDAPSGNSDWRREHAMQAGMGLGVDAYNDAMGWGTGDPED